MCVYIWTVLTVRSAQDRRETADIYTGSSCPLHGCMGVGVHGCRGAQHSLRPTVSKDSMRDLTVAAGSGSASPLASLGEAGIMQHWSDAGPSSPWDLTDTVNKVVVYARNSQLPPHVGIWFCRLPERMKHWWKPVQQKSLKETHVQSWCNFIYSFVQWTNTRTRSVQVLTNSSFSE